MFDWLRWEEVKVQVNDSDEKKTKKISKNTGWKINITTEIILMMADIGEGVGYEPAVNADCLGKMP